MTYNAIGEVRSINNVTTKQRALLTVVCAGDGRDHLGNMIPVDIDQILERMEYKTSKESLQFSLRALIHKGIIYKAPYTELRRGRARAVIFPTDDGKTIINAVSMESVVENDNSSIPQVDFITP